MLKRVSNQQQIYCFKVLPHRNACLRLSSPHSDAGQSLEYKIFPSDHCTSQEGGGHRIRQGRSLTAVQASQCHGTRPGGCGRGARLQAAPARVWPWLRWVTLKEQPAGGWPLTTPATTKQQVLPWREACMVYVSLREYGLITKENCTFAEKPGICHLRWWPVTLTVPEMVWPVMQHHSCGVPVRMYTQSNHEETSHKPNLRNIPQYKAVTL